MNIATAQILVRHHAETLRRTGCLPFGYANLSTEGQLTELLDQLTRWSRSGCTPLKVVRLYCGDFLPRLKTFEAWQTNHSLSQRYIALQISDLHLKQVQLALNCLISLSALSEASANV